MKELSKNIVIVNSKELGTECWSPERFLGRCFLCKRYSRCKASCKVVNKKYDDLVKKFSKLKRQIEEMRKGGKN